MKTFAVAKRLFLRFPFLAGVASVVLIALVSGGAYAIVQSTGAFSAGTAERPSRSSEALPPAHSPTPGAPSDSSTPSATSTPSLSPTSTPSLSPTSTPSLFPDEEPYEEPQGKAYVVVNAVGPMGQWEGEDSNRTRWDESRGTVAFFARGSGSGVTLYEVNLDGTGLRSVWTGSAQIDEVAWSPDGRSVAIMKPRSTYATMGDDTLLVVDLDGGTTRTVLMGKSIEQISWSADGERLWFATAESSNYKVPGAWTISTWDASTGSVVAVRPGRDPAHAPGIAQFAALVDSDGDGTYGTWLLDDDGNLLSPVSSTESTTYFYDDRREAPAWSPDGRFVVYCTPVIGTHDPGGSETCTGVRVAGLSAAFTLERVWGTERMWFSPDGQAVLARTDYGYEVANTTTGSVRRVGAPGERFTPLSWYTSSDTLMYAKFSEEYEDELPYVFSISTGEVDACLASPIESGARHRDVGVPSISPSGRYVLESLRYLTDGSADAAGAPVDAGKTILWELPRGFNWFDGTYTSLS